MTQRCNRTAQTRGRVISSCIRAPRWMRQTQMHLFAVLVHAIVGVPLASSWSGGAFVGFGLSGARSVRRAAVPLVSTCAPRSRFPCVALRMAGDVSVRIQQMHSRLKGLKVAELRQLLGEFGEKADKLKKAEIIERIIALTETKGSPLEKPAHWSQVDPTQHQAQAPPQGARGGSRAMRSGRGAADVTGMAEREEGFRGRELVPTGVTAYTGEQAASTGAGSREEASGWEEADRGGGKWRGTDVVQQRHGRGDTSPSQDYTKADAAAAPPGRRAGGGSQRAQDRGDRADAVPKRGPFSGKRLASSAALLSGEELEGYLEPEAGRRTGARGGSGSHGIMLRGPGPQAFPQTYKGDMIGESSGEGSSGRKHTADMELCFLGTASCLPSLTRGVSSVALRLMGRRGAGSSTWIFDAGEGTQIQIQKSWCRPSTIDKIFITHLHGDHSFGVVGLMCLIGQDRDRDEPLEIFGPAGLRALLRVTLQLTGSRMLPPYRVIELHQVPFLHSRWVRPPSSACDDLHAPRDRRFKEVDEGEDLYPELDGSWRCCVTDNGVSVIATAMQHTMPCVGYCVEEPKGEDRLRVDLVEDVVERNKKGLQEIYGRGYKRVFKDIKALRPGQQFEMPSGEIVSADQVLIPARHGRKVVILGDTCDASSMIPHAMGADVVVHEATNAWIAGLDDKSPEAVEKDTIAHGHSTPEMAGDFARAVGARQLVLTHFSPRYRGDKADFARRIMWQMEEYARHVSGLQGEEVIAAWDLMTLAIERPGYLEDELNDSQD